MSCTTIAMAKILHLIKCLERLICHLAPEIGYCWNALRKRADDWICCSDVFLWPPALTCCYSSSICCHLVICLDFWPFLMSKRKSEAEFHLMIRFESKCLCKWKAPWWHYLVLIDSWNNLLEKSIDGKIESNIFIDVVNNQTNEKIFNKQKCVLLFQKRFSII